jgi:hypothetical protein
MANSESVMRSSAHIVTLEALSGESKNDTPKSWRYAILGMTASCISVKLDRAAVFTRSYVNTLKDRENWTHFWEEEPRR